MSIHNLDSTITKCPFRPPITQTKTPVPVDLYTTVRCPLAINDTAPLENSQPVFTRIRRSPAFYDISPLYFLGGAHRKE